MTTPRTTLKTTPPGRGNKLPAIDMPFLRDDPDGCVVSVWLQPRASKTAITGIYDDLLKITVCSPALEGRANKEVTKYLARLLGMSPGGIDIVSGAHSRRKQILVRGVSSAAVRSKLDL